MARFTVRVELRDPHESDYLELHKIMELKGFSRTLTTNTSGVVYQLPVGEYAYESETMDNEAVGKLVEAIAEKIRPNPMILVTQSAGRYVLNLTRI